ncbi:MAG: elongation factor P maturation arginine rhamnosyltransferase EarP [Burkholderiales bacterium]|nr:elongation factor P maturation arginine rhamnosyltransferase EarP [Burkholderiales bacterium]
MRSMQWDLFCRVVDNFGDIGVCWRLAADLASRGERVRLWVDDASALRWMAPDGASGVTVHAWPSIDAGVAPADVVVEAFGAELPAWFVQRMARAPRAPVWINLEYLSAQAYVERAHRLSSPQVNGPGAGLRKWFFYPGFTARTGGLIREPDLSQRQREFDAGAWLQAIGAPAQAGERVVSMFCYDQPALPALLDQWAGADQPATLLLATAGHAARQVSECLGASLRRGGLRAVLLPALTQPDYDHLLWACDLNFVRGEDSLARAQWAGKPFVWQIYPQHDAVHIAKLDAFLARFLVGAEARWAADLGRFWHAWNATVDRIPALPAAAPWQRQCAAWRAGLLDQPDLTTQLIGFAAQTR